MKLLLIANGEPVNVSLLDLKTFDKIICVDGGLNSLRFNITPDVIIGDFDSVDAKKMNLFRAKSKIIHKNTQEISDLKFALQYCLKFKPDEIVIINAISTDRFDHSLCNILLLMQTPRNIRIKIITKTQKIFIVHKEITLKNLDSKTISIIPLTNCRRVVTSGLKWEINKDLKFGFINGISNVIVSKLAKISLERGKLLIITEFSDKFIDERTA